MIELLKKIEYALRKDSLTDSERTAAARTVVCAAISKAQAIPDPAQIPGDALMREAIRQAMEDRPGWYDTCREALSQPKHVPAQGAVKLDHGMNCPALGSYSNDGCTCGLRYRIELQTEREMHAAWRKRAEEAEAALSSVTSTDRAPPDPVISEAFTELAEGHLSLDRAGALKEDHGRELTIAERVSALSRPDRGTP